MNSRTEVGNCIHQVLIPFCDRIPWEDFSDRGNPCYNPYDFNSPAEEIEAAYTRALVMLEIPKNSNTHTILSHKIANQLGNKWITYDWLIKAVSRVLAGTTYDELLSMLS